MIKRDLATQSPHCLDAWKGGAKSVDSVASLRRVRDVVVDELAPDGGDDHEVVVRAELVRVDRHRDAPRRRKELQG